MVIFNSYVKLPEGINDQTANYAHADATEIHKSNVR